MIRDAEADTQISKCINLLIDGNLSECGKFCFGMPTPHERRAKPNKKISKGNNRSYGGKQLIKMYLQFRM